MIDFLIEIFTFLKSKKKLWMAPLIIVMIVLGALLLFAENSVIAPLIYTIF
jgi:uncharacterized membrane protein YjdF|tara:strand:+ start:287 stop:439 length:153 start_codon:yes stop_codon:yes gene_type:complete